MTEWPGEKLLIALWQTLADKGVGALLRPQQRIRDARAEADAVRILAQANKDAEEILAGNAVVRLEGSTVRLLEHRDVRVGEPASPDSIAIIREVELARQVRAERNTAKAIAHAVEELRNDPSEPPKESIDEDWLYRWRDAASSVSAEHLQNLWGRVLAGELRQPGSISLRTLDALRNMSKEEAEEIGKAKAFAVSGLIFRPTHSDERPFSLSAALRLQELGVLGAVEATGLAANRGSDRADKFFSFLIAGQHALVIEAEDPSRTYSIPCWLITALGKQLLSLVPPADDAAYLIDLGKHIALQRFSVKMGTLDKNEKGELICRDATSIEAQ
jgi:hypothetical protein